MYNRVLALGAHYDDIEFGVGGTLIRHIQHKDEVFMAVLDSDEFRTGDIEKRLREQLNVIDMLGVNEDNLFCFKMKDSISHIVNKLDELKVNIIYAPFDLDTHQSHRKCSYIGQSVCRKALTNLFFYHSGSTYNFNPTVFSLIDFRLKKKLLLCFKSQIDCGGINIESVRKCNSYWASLITDASRAYAEGLVVRKSLYKL